MSRMGVWSQCVLRLSLKQGFRHNGLRCLSSVSSRQHTILSRKNRVGHRVLGFEPGVPNQKSINFRLYADYPDHYKIALPALSPTMEMGTIASWAKKEGDKLNEGDLLAEIETDKATVGFETPEEGYLAKILVPAGTKDVPIGKLVCIIVENESDIAAFKDFKDEGTVTKAAPAPAAKEAPKAAAPASPPPRVDRAPSGAPAAAPSTKGRVYASPMAKNLAEKKNLRLESVGKGTGLFGSITTKDLEGVSAGAPSEAPHKVTRKTDGAYTDIPVSNIRGVIAKRLLQSKQTIPHYYTTMDVCVDEVMKVRAKLNKSLEKSGVKLSVNDFIIKAAALASKKVPEVNSAWMDSFIREFNAVDVSVAVSTDKGLITPIVFDADRKGLIEISKDVKLLANKAREGKLKPEEFQGGTFSVSNLGMYGVTHFCAIINPPQACILAIGGVQERMVPSKTSDHGVKSSFISVTLSSDHRVVDGAVAATWLTAFKEYMETPVRMIL